MLIAYYQKIYGPILKNPDVISGMDYLLYAIAVAELKTTTATSQKHFRELRYEVSKIIRTLVEDLPTPDAS